MVITKLIGGLGNQMFQYAAGSALALQHNTELKVDALLLAEDPGAAYTKRHFELTIFDTAIEQVTKYEVSEFMTRYRYGLWNKMIHKFSPSQLNKHYFLEKGPYFHPDIFETSADVYISGFWQNENYFTKYADQLRKAFTIKKEFLAGTDELLRQILNTRSVMLHIRRGDYISNAVTNAFHGVCSPEYYQQAVKTISLSFPDLELFVFSDDMAWCRKNLQFNAPVHFVETGSAFKDLHLMQNCRHAVIANSSFSWWAAWLNDSPSKIVIAPKQWFSDPSVQNTDIVPANWIKL